MDLPTYTNIWRIEKRLYKLYDLRLPMPLPIVWIGVFVGVFVPWSLLLVLVGVPVEMPWHVLFLVPPGIVTWLSTRPVIEGKRLTELLESQLRYLGQPKAWYRLAPTSEPEAVTFSGRVWRSTPVRAKSKAPRKSRQPQRKREGQRIAGPRQVRPAVAAAAAAAGQAPVAEPATTGRSGWGSRRGAAPALSGQVRQATASGAPETVKQPILRQEGLSGGSGRRQDLPLVAVPRGPGGRGAQGTRGAHGEVGDDVVGAGSAPEPVERQSAARRETGAGQGRGAGGRASSRAASGRATPELEPARREVEDRETPHAAEGRETAGWGAVGPGAADRDAIGRGAAGRDAERAVVEGRVAGRDVAGPDDVGDERAGEAVPGFEGGHGAPDEAEAGQGAVVPIRTGESRRPGAGKPIDTEALRRLRKLAASADAPAEAAEGRAEDGGRDGGRRGDEWHGDERREGDRREGERREGDRRGGGRREDEVARDQHRKGQPPRLGPALVLSGTQRVWPPINPNAKPLPRPSISAGEREEGRAEAASADSAASAVQGETAGAGTRGPSPQGDVAASAAPPASDAVAGTSGTQSERKDREKDDVPQRPGSIGDSSRRAGSRELRAVGDAPAGTAAPRADAAAADEPEESGGRREPEAPAARRSGTGEGRAPRAAGADDGRTARDNAGPGELQGPTEAGQEPDERPEQESAERPGKRPDDRPGQRLGERPGERPERAVAERSGRKFDEVAAQGLDAGAAQDADERDEQGSGELVVPVPRPGEGRVRRVESVVGRDSGGWRRIAQVVVGGGGVRTDGSEIDEARARSVFRGSRRVVVLGCTGGAGQSTTALMLGHTFAKYRDDRVVAVDANTGGTTLTSKIEPETPETLTSLLSGLDRVSGYLTMRGYTTRTASGLEVISADTDAGAEQRLADRSYFSDHRLGESMRLLDRHYKLAVIDPAAALAARVLPYADQLVLVVPASEEASEAVAMTYEWLDGHGCAELRRRAVMVVNGVSRRSMADVEQAESVASGRCRAIVRVPWEDDLAPGGAEVVDLGQLRAAGRRAYLALAGVVVAGFAAQTVRPSEEELASDPPGTRIGER
ncbi:TcpE family conjugal transfer membrane protein [Nonomuraea zeae]|uniref:TcpE family conjugal transfer membrane protein n=1 Tax=Nonomuraea zeae TaxID=1642303 RepID=UPI001478BDCB|nr:TcpE family conjugal transfer membrane protein [Nonomuraea zeae]